MHEHSGLKLGIGHGQVVDQVVGQDGRKCAKNCGSFVWGRIT